MRSIWQLKKGRGEWSKESGQRVGGAFLLFGMREKGKDGLRGRWEGHGVENLEGMT